MTSLSVVFLRHQQINSCWEISPESVGVEGFTMDRSTTPPLATSATTNTSPLQPRLSSDSQQLSPPATPTNARHRPGRASNPKMEPGSLPIPPAPTASDLPVDKELLQRWSSSNSPNGTPAANQRPLWYAKRHASFDSPREVPLPSPSLSSSLSPGGTLAPSFPSHLSNFSSSGTTPSAKRTAGSPAQAHDVSSGYFPAQLPAASSSSTQSPSSSDSSGSGSSSSQSRFSSFSSHRHSSGYLGEQYPVFEDDHKNRDSGSDWTNQTSAPPSPQTANPCRTTTVSGAPSAGGERTHTRSSSSQFDGSIASLGQNTTSKPPMTQMSSPPHSQPPTTEAASGRTTTLSTPIFPYPRPYSLPGVSPNSQNQSCKPLDRTHTQPTEASIPERRTSPPRWPDRSSSASLPLPAQVPFHTLPRATHMPGTDGLSLHDAGIGVGLGRLRMVDQQMIDAGDAHATRVRQAHRSEVGEQTQQQRNNYPYSRAAPSSSNSSSYGSSSDGTGSAPGSSPASKSPSPPPQRPPSPSARHRRSVSPFRAPQPPPRPFTSPSSQSSGSSGLNVPRSQTQAQNQHSNGLSGSARSALFAPPSYPAPEPPTILAPNVTSPGPFLSHAPPPPDSWIEVETSNSEYRLVVRLPGFRRDGITLATKRRRILHVVADSWDNEGGHFERRISFGYDADLVQVRAEFDGEILRISIPRRIPPVEIWTPTPPRQGPVGRLG